MYLKDILEQKREGLEERISSRPWSALLQELPAPPTPACFSQAIIAPGLSVVAEIKRASPSKGMLAPDLQVAETAVEYELNGAAALSVLTEERFFQGSLEDLQSVKKVTMLPVLRKDFLFDPYQILEARWAGADAVLLIMAILSDGQAIELASCAREFGLEILAEVHREEEIEKALEINADLIGINNRDLETFSVSLETTYRIYPLIPKEYPVIAESGVRSGSDLRALKKLGIDGVLIGEALVSAERPGEALKNLLTAVEGSG